MSLDSLVKRLKQHRKGLTPKQQDELFARLRENGRAEMRLRWAGATRRGTLSKDPHRALFLRQVEEWSKPNLSSIRSRLGEQEASFQEGVAAEARVLLQNFGPRGGGRFG